MSLTYTITITPPLIFLVAVLGLIIGSFLNVCIYRIPEDLSVVHPRSQCVRCKKLIPWYLNIPVFSWLYLRGKCNNCDVKISIRYPLVEILTSILFVTVLFTETHWVALPFFFYFVSSLIIATFVDLDHWIIPDKITLPGIVIGLASSFLIPEHRPLDQFLGIVIGGGSLLAVGYIYLKWKNLEGIGGGDIKFLAMGGAFLGVGNIVLTLVLSSVLGAIVGTIAMLISGKGGKTAIPFGPALSLGLLISYLFGTEIIRWYLDLPRGSYGMISP